MFSGKKTYILAAASILYAGFGLYTHNLDFNAALQVGQVALASAFVRHGVASK